MFIWNAPLCTMVPGTTWARPGRKLFFQPDDSVPGPQLISAVGKEGPAYKANGFVKSNGSLIVGGDQGIQRPVPLTAEDVLQSLVQGLPHAPSPGLRGQIDRAFRTPAVGGPLPWRAGVGIAQNTALLLPDQPGELGDVLGETKGKFLRRGDLIFKADGGALHKGTVNFPHFWQVCPPWQRWT